MADISKIGKKLDDIYQVFINHPINLHFIEGISKYVRLVEKTKLLKQLIEAEDQDLRSTRYKIPKARNDNVRMYKTQDFPKALRLVFSYLEHPLNHWKSPEFIEQRTLLNVYFNKGVSYNKFSGFGTPKLPLVLEVLTQSNTSKINMVEMPGVKPGSKTFLPSN